MKTKTPAAILWLLFLPALASAATGRDSYFSNPLFNTLLGAIVLLAVIIVALASAMKNFIGSELFADRLKHRAKGAGPGKAVLLIAALATATCATAQTASAPSSIGGLDQATFYLMLSVIAAELIVLVALFRTFTIMMGTHRQAKRSPVAAKRAKPLLDKVNATVTLEEEESILLEHDYDGIRELDNVLPPWWKYGFYLTIVVAVMYMVVYHVTGALPLQKAEYETSVRKAEAEVAEYMKNSAANVDETTVKMLADEADLAHGKELYSVSCAACHGRFGEGGVGPNLTDDYWLHSGGMPDIFKSIKYGWPDKGMKSWKDDFSPMQIAQIASYIKSLRGSNPPNGKTKQGDLYNGDTVPADSIAAGGATQDRLTSQALPGN